MKLFLDYEPNTSGKGKFLQRLLPVLADIGVKVCSDQNRCDIALGISWWHSKIKIPRVVRVDGVHLTKNDKSDYKNNRIRTAIKKSHGVIFQSQYAKSKVTDKLGVSPKKSTVIFNGANPADYAEKTPLRGKFNVISSAKWCHRNGYRKHKRVHTVMEVAEATVNPDIHFYIAGKLLDKFNDTRNLTFLGQLDDDTLRRYLASADLMLYPAKYDWCPNAVVEALCANTPVVCTDGHGVEELVRACGGVVVSNDIDVAQVVDAIVASYASPPKVNVDPVHVQTVALQYKQFFEEVIGGDK